MFLVLFLILVVEKLLNLILGDAHIDSSKGINDAANPIPKFSNVFRVQFEAFPDVIDARLLVYLSVFTNDIPDILD
ncbi:hypothetical protein N7470_006499 [Penicillium chermesinum]|nr:hypothetical protein N7470_006499 [Penicillium chermesinum]